MGMNRFKFFLPSRYFQDTRAGSRLSSNAMSRTTCQRVLKKAFSISTSESAASMDANPGGFTIVCRPDQFAHFIFFRDEADECINGIKDLKLQRLEDGENCQESDMYTSVAQVSGVDREAVKRVLQASRFAGHLPSPKSLIINASQRSRDER